VAPDGEVRGIVTWTAAAAMRAQVMENKGIGNIIM